VEGPGSRNIVLDGGDLSKAAALLAYRDGAGQQAVKVRG
jgi:hypothetical protein